MGSSFSQQLAEAKEREGLDLIVENVHIKSKDLPSLTKKLLSEVPAIATIELKGCKIKKLPSSISSIYCLHTLVLRDNRLTSLPVEIGQLVNLTELDLSGNSFNKFPVELLSIQKIERVDFSRNQLSAIPNCQSGFRELTSINFEKNEFSVFPISLISIPKLQKIELNYNKISQLPIADLSQLQHLKEVHLRGNLLTQFPRPLRAIGSIQHLDLSENQLKDIPNEIIELSSLQVLELQHNQITSIPLELCSLDSLSTLQLSDNQISSLPEQLGNLSNLTELYLRENRLVEIPSSIGRLVNLRKLYLEFNQLASIPPEIADLKKIVVLILHHNSLRVLPDCLCMMISLLRLSLDDNPLEENLLQLIKEEGALSLIRVEEQEEGGGGKANRNTLRKSFRQGENNTNSPRASLSANQLSRSTSIKSISDLANEKSAAKTMSGPASKSARRTDSSKDVPSFSKFKHAFDNLLEEQDFSQKKREVLKKLPENEKWNLLSQYKGSTLNLIRNSNSTPPSSGGAGGGVKSLLQKSMSTSNNANTVKGPKDFIPLLKENRANKNTMEKIKTNLKQSDWVSKFVDASGIQAIISFLRQLYLKKPQSARDMSFMLDALDIIQILMKVSLKTFLTTSGSVEAVAMGLYCNFIEVKTTTLNVLEMMCQDESVCSMMTLEALSKLSEEFEEEFRFMPLIQFLEGSNADSAVLTCLSLINFIVDSIDDLEERFQTRMEFMTMGFKEILANLPRGFLFEIQKANFDAQTKNDYEDMVCRKQAASSAKDLSEGKLSISITTETLHTTFELQTSEEMTIGDIVNQIVSKFKIDNAEREYGLFEVDVDEQQKYLPDEDTIKDSNLSSPQLLFRMKDWELTIFLTPTNQTITLAMDPQNTIEHTIKELINLEIIPNGNYCLKVNIDDILFRLDDTKPLITIDLLVDKSNRYSLVLEENPIQIKVFLAEDTWQIMEFDLHIMILELFNVIVNHAGLSTINSNDYRLVLEDKTSDSSSLLDFDKTLNHYDISDPDNCSLKFVAVADSKKNQSNDDDDEDEEECNIWEEPPDSPLNITFEQGKPQAIQNIETATLNKLVERVTSADEYDVDFVNVFVLMFHGFTTEERLWNKLLERFEVPPNVDAQIISKIRARVCIFIKNWVEKDLLGPHVRSLIETFVITRMNEPQYQLMSKVILERLNNPKGNEEMQINEKPPVPLLPRNVFSKLTIYDIEDLEIARQMTIHLFNIYRRIRPIELFRSAWNKEKLKHLSPNVLEMIDYYNRISNMIATAIVMEDKVRNRAKLLEKVISIADKLRELNNFHLLSAFICAINNSAILRLKFTKARINKKIKAVLANLEETMSMDTNFVHYRNALAAAKPPCIPFMGVYLTDLTFIADGNPDRIDRRINFVKQKFVYGVIATIKAYQTTPYNLDSVDSIQQLIHNLPVLPDKEIYAMSLKVEPRNAERADIQ